MTYPARTADYRKKIEKKAGRPPLYETPEELAAKFDEYFDRQDNQDRPYTVTGLCSFAGFLSRQSLYDYAGKPEFVDTIKKARMRIEERLAEELLTRKGSVVGLIFALKNMFPENWKDRQETTVDDPYNEQQALLPPRAKNMEEWTIWYQEVMGKRKVVTES